MRMGLALLGPRMCIVLTAIIKDTVPEQPGMAIARQLLILSRRHHDIVGPVVL